MSKRLISFVLSAVLILSLSMSAFADRVKPRPHQDFSGNVDIGDFSLFVEIKGSANRSKREPTIVFEGGYGDDHFVWSGIQSIVSTNTQTISYDRAVLGQRTTPLCFKASNKQQV